jgi:hypothetical protein
MCSRGSRPKTGGPWEARLGGMLIRNLPHAPAFDADREFERQIDQDGG